MATKKQTTVSFTDHVEKAIKEVAEKTGVPWTTMVTVLVMEALSAREQRK